MSIIVGVRIATKICCNHQASAGVDHIQKNGIITRIVDEYIKISPWVLFNDWENLQKLSENKIGIIDRLTKSMVTNILGKYHSKILKIGIVNNDKIVRPYMIRFDILYVFFPIRLFTTSSSEVSIGCPMIDRVPFSGFFWWNLCKYTVFIIIR